MRTRMQAQRRRDTGIELAIRRSIHRQGLRFRVDVAPIAGMRCRADLVFHRARVAVFVDGCFWHCCPKHATWPKENAAWWREKLRGNVRRDRDTDRRLRFAGWLVIRVWEHQDPDQAADRVTRAIQRRKPR